MLPQSAALLSELSALQHERSPRPLPLFLEMVRMVAANDPETARNALSGLAKYERAERPPPRAPVPEIARVGAACLRDQGGSGPPALLVPSLINPPNILDLDEQTSLATAVRGMGRRVLLLDWGSAEGRSGLSVADHVTELLVPLITGIGEPPALIGYCLGGTMAIAAAGLIPVECVATLAAPWHFADYPADSRATLHGLWAKAAPVARQVGVLPVEVLQAAFWSLDPERTVRKFADFAALDGASEAAARFVRLEDWANAGEPLPYPAARELLEDLFGADLPGRGEWMVGGSAAREHSPVPILHCTASRDRITPAATCAAGPSERILAGHVGMVIGSARRQLHAVLNAFLDPACR
jgi:polyhydroxyalkanoate synthase